MRIGILKCGTPPKTIVKQYGDCDMIYYRFLSIPKIRIYIKCFECEKMQFPTEKDYEELNGFIITGSKHSSYDNLKWINKLKEKIVEMDNQKIKLVGICFGHQVITEALGGKVIPNPLGWEVSVKYIYTNKLGENLTNKKKIPIYEMHKDVIQSMEGTGLEEYSFNNYGNQGTIKGDYILTIQGHPEYFPKMIETLLELRQNIIPENIYKEGMVNVNKNIDKIFWSKLIIKFFRK